MNAKLSLILLNWKRPDNVRRLVEHYLTFSIVDEIVVFNNNPELTIADARIVCVNTNRDLGLFTRFAIAALAKNDAIFFVDDDLQVPEYTAAHIFAKWQEEPDRIHGLTGRNVVAGEYSKALVFGPCDIVLTRCAIARKEYCIEALRYVARFNAELGGEPVGNGEDILLSLLAKASSGKPNIAYNLPLAELPAPHSIFERVAAHYAHRTNVVRWCALNLRRRDEG